MSWASSIVLFLLMLVGTKWTFHKWCVIMKQVPPLRGMTLVMSWDGEVPNQMVRGETQKGLSGQGCGNLSSQKGRCALSKGPSSHICSQPLEVQINQVSLNWMLSLSMSICTILSMFDNLLISNRMTSVTVIGWLLHVLLLWNWAIVSLSGCLLVGKLNPPLEADIIVTSSLLWENGQF